MPLGLLGKELLCALELLPVYFRKAPSLKHGIAIDLLCREEALRHTPLSCSQSTSEDISLDGALSTKISLYP